MQVLTRKASKSLAVQLCRSSLDLYIPLASLVAPVARAAVVVVVVWGFCFESE